MDVITQHCLTQCYKLVSLQRINAMLYVIVLRQLISRKEIKGNRDIWRSKSKIYNPRPKKSKRKFNPKHINHSESVFNIFRFAWLDCVLIWVMPVRMRCSDCYWPGANFLPGIWIKVMKIPKEQFINPMSLCCFWGYWTTDFTLYPPQKRKWGGLWTSGWYPQRVWDIKHWAFLRIRTDSLLWVFGTVWCYFQHQQIILQGLMALGFTCFVLFFYLEGAFKLGEK